MAQALVERFDGEVPGPDGGPRHRCRAWGARPPTSCAAWPWACPACPSTPTSGGSRCRLGLTDETDPVKVEHALNAMIPAAERGVFCLRLILHGRRVCVARSPQLRRVRAQRLLPLVPGLTQAGPLTKSVPVLTRMGCDHEACAPARLDDADDLSNLTIAAIADLGLSVYVGSTRFPPPGTWRHIWDPPPSVALPTPLRGASALFPVAARADRRRPVGTSQRALRRRPARVGGRRAGAQRVDLVEIRRTASSPSSARRSGARR